jgi:hypothetical protein
MTTSTHENIQEKCSPLCSQRTAGQSMAANSSAMMVGMKIV